jgi:hypothetical protein
MTAPRPASPWAAAMQAGAGSRIPELAGTGEEIPSLDLLREALRGPQTPLPAPRSVRAAALRVQDLAHAEHFAEALYLARRFEEMDAHPADRVALLRAHLAAAIGAQDPSAARDLVPDLVRTIARAGAPAQARATADVLGEHLGEHLGDDRAPTAAASAPAPAHGRRRGRVAALSPGLLAVVRCLELPRPSELRREMRSLHAALTALPDLEDPLVEDPGPLLAARYAQDLEAVGSTAEATRLALDVLDEVAHLQARPGGFADISRAEVSAHAVLARTLAEERPRAAVGHSLAALQGLREVEDPPLRVGLITDLLRALVRGDLQDHATFTAGRLASLTRTLPHDAQRIEPLLAVGAQRVAARRFDAAEVVLREAQRLSTSTRDRRSRFEASRLLARLHHEQGQGPEALDQLRRAAADARWVADDLLTPSRERPALVGAELDAEALAMRHALDLERPDQAASAARAIVRRVRTETEAGTLPAPLLWDHEVDARTGALLATGLQVARTSDPSAPRPPRTSRRPMRSAIGRRRT